MPRKDSASLSAVRQVAEAIGRWQRALMSREERTVKTVRASGDDRTIAPRANSKTVLLTPAAPASAEDVPWELKDPAATEDDSPIIDVAMSLGSILYAGETQDATSGHDVTSTAGGMGRAPTGDERVLQELVGEQAGPVMQDQSEVTRLSEVQIRQAVTVIPAN